MTGRRVFVEPPWDAPLDPAGVLARIPEEATIAGMYPIAMVEAAEKAGKTLRTARERYLPFGFYPQREHAQLIVDASALLFPDWPLRKALRAVGRAAPEALLRSTLGRVVLGSAEGVHAVVESIVKTYPINLRQSDAEIVERGDRHVVVHLRGIHFFLDSHHVGVFEGTLRHAGVKGAVTLDVASANEAHFHCAW